MTAPINIAQLHFEAIVALPLSPLSAGERSPSTLFAIHIRNAMLREAAGYFPGASRREAARLIRQALERYASGGWRRDRLQDALPPNRIGRVEAIFWRMLKLHDHVPGLTTIREALR